MANWISLSNKNGFFFQTIRKWKNYDIIYETKIKPDIGNLGVD